MATGQYTLHTYVIIIGSYLRFDSCIREKIRKKKEKKKKKKKVKKKEQLGVRHPICYTQICRMPRQEGNKNTKRN